MHIKIGAIVLCIVLVAMCVLAPLSKASATEEIIISEVIEIVIETLKAWGISIYSEISSNVEEWMYGQVIEYITGELEKTWNAWITGMNWVYDNFGRRMLNALGLNNIFALTQWLISEFSLTDNSTVTVPGSYNVNGLVCYKLPVTLEQGQAFPGWHNLYYDGQSDVYVAFYGGAGDQFTGCYFFSRVPFTVHKELYKANGTLSGSASTEINSYGDGTGTWYAGSMTSGSQQGGSRVNNPWATIYPNQATIRGYLAGTDHVNSQPPIVITTGDITLPTNDPSYTQGMSIIYYPDGTVGYLQVNWPDSYSIDNLPAIVSTSSVTDPGFNQVFQPLRAFVTTFSGGMAVIKDIVFHLPTEAVAIFYAITSITVIFGALHMFKEH